MLTQAYSAGEERLLLRDACNVAAGRAASQSLHRKFNMTARHSVLVPVDGSVSALIALAVACRRTRSRRGVRIVVLNVQPAMPSSNFASRAAIRDHQQRMAAEVFQRVAEVAKREKVRVQQEMVVGMPAIEIARMA
jgi:nucleotide-binding universal stress UspA family protein